MSEFYFDYKCIAMGGQEVKEPEKALAFYLYQKSEKGSMMCVQVYIPKEMQKKYIGAQVYFSPNDVDFPDYKSGKVAPIIWRSEYKIGDEREGNYIDTDNCIYIEEESEQLSGCGVIAFIEGKDLKAIPDEKNCYKFVINFAKKEIISYRVLERTDSVLVEVLYPLVREDIELGIRKKRGAKPVLVNDFNVDGKRMHFDEAETIVLKANGRVEDAVKKELKVDDPSKYDFRLVFKDPKYSTHYLLVDESDYTIEDYSQRKKDISASKKIVKEPHRCPYCGGILAPLPKVYGRKETAIVDCAGVEISNSSNDKRLQGKVTRVCKENLSQISKRGASDISCIEKDKMIIPEKYDEMPSMNVAVAGFPKSGKTIYLASIFNMIAGGDAHGIHAESTVLDTIRYVFDKSGGGGQTVDEVTFLSVDEKKGFTIDDTVERARMSPRENIKSRYVLSANKHVESQSPKDEAWKLSWHPIAFRVGNMGYAYFYDVPGEVFTMQNTEKVRSLDMADCLIAVIDGAPDVENPVKDLAITLKNIERICDETKGCDIKSKPIAIVFTKHDLKLTDYLGKERNKDFCFDDNCHVVRENIIAMLPKNGKYSGSALERHIDCSSYELEHYLKSRDPQGYKALKDNYEDIKFFTCSALGSDTVLGAATGDNKKDVLFKPRRLRVELPIIWLMYKKGLIKR